MKLKLELNNPLPLHKQAESLLRELIQQDEYKMGQLLPGEVELSNKLGIARNTLRQAIYTLVSEGLLYRKKGVGTKITGKIASKGLNWQSFTQEMKLLGYQPKTFETQVTIEKPPKEVALFFNCLPDCNLCKLERLRGNEKGPFVNFVSYFTTLVKLDETDDLSIPLYSLLEAKYFLTANVSREEISAVIANVLLANKLNVPVGYPLLQRKRLVYDTGMRPLEYNIGHYLGDKFVYTAEFTNYVFR